MCRLGQIREVPGEDPATLGPASLREPVSLETRPVEQAFLVEMLEKRSGRSPVQSQETLQHDHLDLLSEALPLDPEEQLEDLIAPVQQPKRLALGLADKAHARLRGCGYAARGRVPAVTLRLRHSTAADPSLASRNRFRRVGPWLVIALALTVVGCTSAQLVDPDSSPPADTAVVRLYTSVTQDTVDAVDAAFTAAHPDISLEVFRAPTGELNARIAAERREGRIRADVLWLTDPLSMQPYAADGLLRTWSPPAAEAIDPAYRSDAYWGARLLNMVIVAGEDVEPAPTDWADLADPAYSGAVAVPDPGFAGSAFGALGYFALAEDYGTEHLQALSDNGTVQVQSPDEVVTGVAEGRYKAGMTLDYSARQAIERGSPVRMIWPESGAIAMYSPIAVLESTEAAEAAETLVNFVLDVEGQQAIADTGWQPVHPDVEGPPIEGPQVTPDWDAAFERRDELLEEYRAIFGG